MSHKVLFLVSVLVFSTAAFGDEIGSIELENHERLITILTSNDIHGYVQPRPQKDGTVAGGMLFWDGVVQSIRQGLKQRYGKQSGVLLLDGGDQFQGTLISNYSEGRMVYELMSEMGYDAVVPGNHAFDFGPTGWLDDRVNEENPDKDKRGALKKAIEKANFPLLSANTYFRLSLFTPKGKPVYKPEEEEDVIDWARAMRPEFLKPYHIKSVAGLRVAMIGIDNEATPKMTTPENVGDLYFRDGAKTYLEIRKALSDKADLFVLVTHKGNTSRQSSASKLVEEIQSGAISIGLNKEQVLHAVVAGHTHYVNSLQVGGVPIVQAGAYGDRFGRIDLVWDQEKNRVVSTKTRQFSGMRLAFERCFPPSESFCSVTYKKGEKYLVSYEGVLVQPRVSIREIIDRGREYVAPIASRKLGVAHEHLHRHRSEESPMANAVTDALRSATESEVSFANTGGIRAEFKKGDITYADLFQVLPFSNRAVVMDDVPLTKVIALLERSVRTCGAYSALMQSGLRVKFSKDCDKRGEGGFDPGALLLEVRTVSGELLYQRDQKIAGVELDVATLDFLADGGSGYDGFIGIPITKTLGIFRELLTQEWLLRPASLEAKTDGRWININSSGQQ